MILCAFDLCLFPLRCFFKSSAAVLPIPLSVISTIRCSLVLEKFILTKPLDFKLDIPWTSLSTKPVKVYVEGVSVIAVPLDIHNLTKEDIKKRLNSRKAYYLANIDQQALKDDKRERGGLTDNTLHAYI